MCYSHGGISHIYVLAARPAGSESVDPKVRFADLDLYLILDIRIDEN